MANAATTVTENDVNAPTSDAPSALTISNGTVTGSVVALIEATNMPSKPASIVESTQFAPANVSGDNPRRIAPFSFSAAALVANPKRVNRNAAHNRMANATTTAATNT